MPHGRHVRALASMLAASVVAIGIGAFARAPASATSGPARTVNPTYAFGLQNIPKFDERAGRGGWNGTRRRGLAMRQDLGASVGREGLLWSKFQPAGPQPGPFLADFDDAIDVLHRSGMAIEAMVTETPIWASTASNIDPDKPETYKNSPPKGLSAPAFLDGSDVSAPGKAVNPANS